MIKKFLLLVACVVVVVALMPSYVGAASPSTKVELTLEQQYTQAVEKLEYYLSISETGNIVLDAPKGIVSSIDSEVYETLLAGLEQTNSMIDSGYLVANPDFTLTVTEKYSVEGILALSYSGGIDDFFIYWWGCWIYFSDATCDLLVTELQHGATEVGITGLVLYALGVSAPGGIVCTIVGVILGISSWVIEGFNVNNTGIKIALYGYITPVYIGPQFGEPYGLVTGQVSNAATGDPLSYSTVTITKSGQFVQEVETDAYGKYVIALLPQVYMVTASHSGFYDLGRAVAVSDGMYTTMNFQLTRRTGGGGCPFLQVWDGSDYADEGFLDIHNAEGVDVTYEHTLATVPKPVNGRYAFRLTEHPKTISNIDQVQLHAILEDGTVEDLSLRKAWHSEDGNVLNLLLRSDDRRAEEKGADHNGGTNQSIDLEFEALGPNAKAVAFIFTIEGNNMIIK